MDSVLIELAKEWGGLWVALAVAAFMILDRTGIIKRLWSNSAAITRAQISERERLSEDQQRLVTNLRSDIEYLRKVLIDDHMEHERKRKEDKIECDERMAAMEKRLAVSGEDTKNWRKDSMKWRHLSGNIAMYTNNLRDRLIQLGVQPPRFNGWKQFLDEGGDPTEFENFSAVEDHSTDLDSGQLPTQP